MDLTTTISAMKHGIPLLRSLGEIQKKIDNAEVAAELAEVRLKLLDVVGAYSELWEEHRSLVASVEARAAMEWRENVYWKREGDDLVGPFCPKCSDGDDRMVRMTEEPNGWHCTVCPHFQHSPESREREQRAISASRARGRSDF